MNDLAAVLVFAKLFDALPADFIGRIKRVMADSVPFIGMHNS